jgi:acyl-homoserine lactone acylase PvdQ
VIRRTLRPSGPTRRVPRLRLALAAGVAFAAATATPAFADTPPLPTYRANDFSAPLGNPPTALNILPAGENGLATAMDIANFEGSGTRPAHSHDQYDLYQNLLYNVGSLNDAALTQYYKDASFGIPGTDIDTARTVTLNPSVGSVSIYRDTSYGVPHIYGTTIPAMAYGAGYAAAADRLFLIDVLRHLGRGHLAEFIGNSCSIEQGDYAQRLIADYTTADKNAQLAAIAASGPVGAELFSMANAFVQGINQYVTDALSDPTNKLPGDYAVASPVAGLPVLPQANWTASDIIDIASLVGGIFGKGGGAEVANAALYKYLIGVLGQPMALTAFHDFKETNDPEAPTTLNGVSFPYDTQAPAGIDTTLNALTDSAGLTGQKTATGAGCGGTNTLFGGLPHVNMSNALLVSGSMTTDGHPIAVIGPQVGYYAPQILMEQDLHAPDYDARGASFPGTNFLVELGRGRDFAWTATSASSDVVDQKVVLAYNNSSCTTTDPTPANNLFYKFASVCQQLTLISDTETATQTVACNPPPPSTGNCLAGDVNLDHSTYRVLDDSGLNNADHVKGIVQGWNTVGGAPVIVYNQRSTYFHELDSGIGFDMWQHPSMTYDVNSWMVGASNIGYTFNWHYIDSQHIGYYVSGLDPLRNAAVDPGLPTWGGGAAEWQGFLDFNGHAHQADPPQGYLVQWNNKPAPGFAAADDVYNYGLVHRQQLLVTQLQAQLGAHGGHISRANLVQAMETAASQDLSAISVMPELTPLLTGLGAGPQAMIDHINAWVAAGAHRQKTAHANAEYADPSAVGAIDELYPRIVEALFDGVMAQNGNTAYTHFGIPAGYNLFPMGFAGLPNSHSGSSYGSGWEGYVVKALRQVAGGSVSAPFSTGVSSLFCTSGPSNCHAALNLAVLNAYNAMVTANGGSTTVATWTKNTAITAAQAGGTFASFDNIQFTAAGVIGQTPFDWQNRPTFQQVVEFQSQAPPPGNALPEFPLFGGVALGVGTLAAVGMGRRRRRVTTTS